MSDPAQTFRKFRDANDPAGNLAWSSKMARKGLRACASVPPDLEAAFELSDEERVLWRLLKLPRRYMDLENTGVLPAEKARGFFRALVSADVVDVVELEATKPIIPVEIVRLKKEVAGQPVQKRAGGSTTLKPRVFRPDISTPPTTAVSLEDEGQSNVSTPPLAAGAVPKPVELTSPPKTPLTPPPLTPPPLTPPPRTPAPAVPLSDDERALIAEIGRRHQAMATQSHYQFLEVQPTSTPDGIRAAYMKLAKTFHPDRISGIVRDPVAAKQADALFKRLQDAWSTLNDPARRAAYDRTLDASGAAPKPGTGKVRRTDEARVATLKADHLAKTKHYKEAEAQYKAALLLDDQYAPAQLGLAWAIFLNEGRDKQERMAEAKKRLTELADVYRFADAHYKLALLARIEGNEAEHERRISLAVRTDPRHQEAMQELRLIKRRKEGKEGSGSGKGGGLLSKLRR